MLVLVTGETGYVGSHSIAALARAGHRIRVLARSPDRVPVALGPLGVDGVETVVGDVTEPAAVALEGCEAVLYAASVFSMDPRRADEMLSVTFGAPTSCLVPPTGSASIQLCTCRASSRSCRRPTARYSLPTLP
jgi:nucleoside-diphosphate-sugar epimerase